MTANYYDSTGILFDQFADARMKAAFSRFSKEFGPQLLLLAKRFESELAGEGGSVTYIDFQPTFKQFYFYGEPTSFGLDKFGAYGSCLVGAYGETLSESFGMNVTRRGEHMRLLQMQ